MINNNDVRLYVDSAVMDTRGRFSVKISVSYDAVVTSVTVTYERRYYDRDREHIWNVPKENNKNGFAIPSMEIEKINSYHGHIITPEVYGVIAAKAYELADEKLEMMLDHLKPM